MSFSSLKSGDIVGAYLPEHTDRGVPGSNLRKVLVLAVEVDPANKNVEGIFCSRLSDRTHKIRNWDYVLNAGRVDGDATFLSEAKWVIRTHRIDLIPTDPEFMGESPVLFGRAEPGVLRELKPFLEQGMRSWMAEDSYGPRGMLLQTEAALSANGQRRDDFSIDILDDVKTPSAKRKAFGLSTGNFQRDFELAAMQAKTQDREHRQAAHAAFLEQSRGYHRHLGH